MSNTDSLIEQVGESAKQTTLPYLLGFVGMTSAYYLTFQKTIAIVVGLLVYVWFFYHHVLKGKMIDRRGVV